MIVRNPTPALRDAYKCDPDVNLFIYDSDLASWDGRPGGGVQLAPLKKWLISCADGAEDGLCVIRRLHLPGRDSAMDWLEDDKAPFPKMETFMKTVVGRSYENNRLQLARSAAARNKDADLSAFFCSELVSATWQQMGLLPEDFVPSNCSPSRFSSKETCRPDSFARIMRGAYLDREVQIFVRPIPSLTTQVATAVSRDAGQVGDQAVQGAKKLHRALQFILLSYQLPF